MGRLDIFSEPKTFEIMWNDCDSLNQLILADNLFYNSPFKPTQWRFNFAIFKLFDVLK